MKRFIDHLSASLITFLLGITAAHLPLYIQSLGSEAKVVTIAGTAMPLPELSKAKEELRNLSPKESEIVAQAESFVCSHGYTEQQCGSVGRIYFEPGENTGDVEGIWARRHDTLESKRIS